MLSKEKLERYKNSNFSIYKDHISVMTILVGDFRDVVDSHLKALKEIKRLKDVIYNYRMYSE